MSKNSTIWIKLDNPPSVNAIYRSGDRFTYKTQSAKDWIDGARSLIEIEMAKYNIDISTGAIGVGIYYINRNQRFKDLDNILKALLDSIQGSYCNDDKQVWSYDFIRRLYTGERKNKPPFVILKLRHYIHDIRDDIAILESIKKGFVLDFTINEWEIEKYASKM